LTIAIFTRNGRFQQMQKIKSYKKPFVSTGEIILFGETILYWIFSSWLNPIAGVLLSILILQGIIGNAKSGAITAILFLALNLYMALAWISEFNEHRAAGFSFNHELGLIAVVLVAGTIASIRMLEKWMDRMKTNPRPRIVT
jgi:hypothetical protein